MKKQIRRQMKGKQLTRIEWWAFAVFSYLECLEHTEDGITSSNHYSWAAVTKRAGRVRLNGLLNFKYAKQNTWAKEFKISFT